MIFRDKMLQHLKRAEELNNEIDQFDALVITAIERDHGARLDTFPNAIARENMRLMLIGEQIDKRFGRVYTNRARNRDLHMAWAQLYASAAQVTDHR